MTVWGKKLNLPEGQRSREPSKAKESSKLVENHNADSVFKLGRPLSMYKLNIFGTLLF